VNKPSAAKATVHPDQSQESEASSFEPPPPRGAVKTSGASNSAKKISDWDDAQPNAIAKPVERGSETTSNHEGVVHEVLPDVPVKARNTIQGKVRVKVKVAVDRSGNVTAAEFVSPGPSKYFSRLAMGAARDWKFAPALIENRAWNLQFDFRRGGTTATPTAISR
jgi:TonB family protein